MYLPGWLYAVVPYLYVAGGCATVLVFNNTTMALFSGLLLISAGVVIWFMRISNRDRLREVPRLAGDRWTDNTRPGFLEIVWRKAYERGQPTIDEQHRNLFASGNAILDAISMNRSKPEIVRLLDRLIVDLGHHFRDEEAILGAISREAAEAQKKVHEAMWEKANTLRTDFRDGKLPASELIALLIHDLIGLHIMAEDSTWFGKLQR